MVRVGSEVRCTNKSCSVDGACALDWNTQVSQPAVNMPPSLELLSVPSADIDGVVDVPRGWMYTSCSPGYMGTSEEPCEPGAA